MICYRVFLWNEVIRLNECYADSKESIGIPMQSISRGTYAEGYNMLLMKTSVTTACFCCAQHMTRLVKSPSAGVEVAVTTNVGCSLRGSSLSWYIESVCAATALTTHHRADKIGKQQRHIDD